jgi:TolA-binding protein
LDIYREQVLRYQVEVSAILPEVIKKNRNHEDQFPLRTLASTLPGFKNENLELSMQNQKFFLAKKHFNEKNYREAIEKFSEFISRTPFSSNLVEANFLLAESYFQMEDFENCLLVIERMIEQYPSSEMTGYSMIRMGKIYELQDRPEEAVEVYKLVSQSFSDRGIASQAAQSMRNVEL